MNWQDVTFETLYAAPSRNGVYKPKEFHGNGCRIVNMGELFGFDFISSQEMNRLELNDSEFATNSLKDGDFLFGRRSLVEPGGGKWRSRGPSQRTEIGIRCRLPASISRK